MKISGRAYSIIAAGTIPVVFAGALAFAALHIEAKGRATQMLRGAIGWEIMRIDGNREGRSVVFTHESHQQYAAKNGAGCKACHHFNLPNDNVSSCFECHRAMKNKSSIFNHDRHARLFKSKEAYCEECHGRDRSRERVKPCVQCHEEYREPASVYGKVIGYESAMHGNCIGCHQKEDEKLGQKMYTDCGFCHPDSE